ncbi:MAG: L,D-transpeptidase family protein [Ostreibacterium sp.]
MKKVLCYVVFWTACLIGFSVKAAEYILPPEGINVVGEAFLIKTKESETLADIAREYGIGYTEIIQANPDVDRWYPGDNTPIVIPARHVLPDTPHNGLVLNLPEMRIYYYPKPQKGELPKVVTYPVGIGRQDWQTPRGKTSVIQKKENPTWTPPASIKAEHATAGDPLPDVVPAGPDNPLGTRALRLGIPGYLIHGTNKPYGVGMRVSHGCIRMRPEDVEALFDMVPLGETVRIINQPLKISRFAGALFMEFHPPLEEDGLSYLDNLTNALATAHKKLNFQTEGLSERTVETVVKEASGLPVHVAD